MKQVRSTKVTVASIMLALIQVLAILISSTGSLLVSGSSSKAHQSATIELQVEPIDQNPSRPFGDYDCLPTSLAMALQEIDPTGDEDSTRFRDVRTRLRKDTPSDPNGMKVGISFATAVANIPILTGGRWSGFTTKTNESDWTGFLSGELEQGRPVIVAINDSNNFPAGHRYNIGPHVVVVIGLSNQSVIYNDPWDGTRHEISHGEFTAAWSNSISRGGGWGTFYAWRAIVFVRPAEVISGIGHAIENSWAYTVQFFNPPDRLQSITKIDEKTGRGMTSLPDGSVTWTCSGSHNYEVGAFLSPAPCGEVETASLLLKGIGQAILNSPSSWTFSEVVERNEGSKQIEAHYYLLERDSQTERVAFRSLKVDPVTLLPTSILLRDGLPNEYVERKLDFSDWNEYIELVDPKQFDVTVPTVTPTVVSTPSPTAPPTRTPIPPVSTTAPVTVPTIAPRQDPGVQQPSSPSQPNSAGEVAYLSDGGDLWVSNLDGSNATLLISGPISDVEWSHDGSKLVYIRQVMPSGSGVIADQIEIAASDGSDQHVIVQWQRSTWHEDRGEEAYVNYDHVRWGPSDASIFYWWGFATIRGGSGITQYDSATGESRFVSIAYRGMDVSADGTVVFYDKNPGEGDGDISLYAPSGEISSIDDGSTSGGYPTWSPDGSEIALAGDRLQIISNDGSLQRVLIDAPVFNVDWSGSGAFLLYEDRAGLIWQIGEAGGEPHALFYGHNPSVRAGVTSDPVNPSQPSLTGSITLSLFQCPVGMSSMSLDPAACVAAPPDLLLMSIGDSESGLILGNEESYWENGNVVWPSLPLDDYILQPDRFPTGYEAIYAPGFNSQVEGNVYPAGPEYTVSAVAGTSYQVLLTADNPDVQLEVYVLDLYCIDGLCGDDIPLQSPIEDTDPSQAGQVEFWAISCPDAEAALVANGPVFATDFFACTGVKEPQVITLTNELGVTSTMDSTVETDLRLPFGNYLVSHPASGMETTLDIYPNETYLAQCPAGEECHMYWSVVLVLDEQAASDPIGSIELPVESDSSNDPIIAEAIERFGGEWTGTFYQSNPTREWPVRITYWGGPEGTVVGSIEYLPDVCKADLIQLQMVLDFGLSLREQVTTGKENCLSGGTINLDGNSSGLTFTWGHPDSDATGHGTLQKVGAAQPAATGTGSLEIHAVTCPAGYTGTDFYNTCHSNGEAFAEFIVDGGGMTLPMTTQIDPATGAGVAGLDALTPDNYYVLKYTEGTGLPAFVFCSPDQGATTLVSQYIASAEGLTVPVIDGQTVVCDWYSLP